MFIRLGKYVSHFLHTGIECFCSSLPSCAMPRWAYYTTKPPSRGSRIVLGCFKTQGAIPAIIRGWGGRQYAARSRQTSMEGRQMPIRPVDTRVLSSGLRRCCRKCLLAPRSQWGQYDRYCWGGDWSDSRSGLRRACRSCAGPNPALRRVLALVAIRCWCYTVRTGTPRSAR